MRALGRRLGATSLLRLIWLASPALPVGGFSYSEGLEAAVDAGLVTNETDAADWLLDQLHLGLSRSELAVMAQAFRAWQRDDRDAVQSLNDWVAGTRESSELRQQSEQMGRSLALWLANAERGDPRIAALGDLAAVTDLADRLRARRRNAAARRCARHCSPIAFGWAENMVQAALKAIPLGQNAGQRVLARLLDAIPAAVDHAIGLDAGSTPGLPADAGDPVGAA